MNLRQKFWIVGVVAAALSSMLALQMSSPSSDARSLGRDAPSFRLTSSSGEIIDSRAMSGRPYAVFFGFTKCPEICSTTLLELARVMDDLGSRAADFKIYFVSLDPERDTPDALSEFLASFGPRFVGLIGSANEVARAAAAFRVYHRKVPFDNAGYTIDHTTLVYLMDRQGRQVDALSFQERPEIASKRLKTMILETSSAVRTIRHLANCADGRYPAAANHGESRNRPFARARPASFTSSNARDKMPHIMPRPLA